MDDYEHADAARLTNPPLLCLHWDVFEGIVRTIGCRRAESGGVIGGNGDGTEITHYHFDDIGRTTAATYSPDIEFLNRLFRSDWNPKGIRFRGFVHSHPGRMNRPSYGDQVYVERILQAIDDLECLWIPIVNTLPDTGMFQVIPWVAYPIKGGVSVVRGQVQIVSAPKDSTFRIGGVDALGAIQIGVPRDEIVIGGRESDRVATPMLAVNHPVSMKREAQRDTPTCSTGTAQPFNIHNTFERVQNAYDLNLMRTARLVAVGAGGAADWLEAMARAGVGQFILIDPDVVSETNLATQQTYRKDIGRSKVDCIAERIRDINPTALTVTIHKSLDDLSDDEMRQLILDPIEGYAVGRTVLCGLTDDFFAQARVNRLALHCGVPSLCAQVYLEGRGAEITFTYPGITPACHRCILSPRYRHFLDQGRTNDVTSHGTPIFATTRLNALKGFLTLALIHHGSAHPRWGGMLSRIGKRNLLQLRMDPDLSETLGIRVFDRVLEGADRNRLFFDEVVWLAQDQECPSTGHKPCPDCGGTGDLRDVIGRFQDTRLTTPKGWLAQAMTRAVQIYQRHRRIA
jgi:hypothetical protein